MGQEEGEWGRLTKVDNIGMSISHVHLSAFDIPLEREERGHATIVSGVKGLSVHKERYGRCVNETGIGLSRMRGVLDKG